MGKEIKNARRKLKPGFVDRMQEVLMLLPMSIGFALFVLLSILLCCQYYCLSPVHFVYPIYYSIERLQFLESLSINVK